MSGAEAILGVVAGGAGLLSLGLQLGESAVKLKYLYNSAKEAPKTIETLVFDLETMSLALQELERHRQQDNHVGALLARCMLRCQQCTEDINEVVEKLARYLARFPKGGGRLYAAFKEKEVKDLLGDLENAKSSLELAYTMYLAQEQDRWHQMHLQATESHAMLLTSLHHEVSTRHASISQQIATISELSSLTLPHQDADVSNQTASTVLEDRDTTACSADDGRSLRLIKVSRRSRTNFKTTFRLPTWICSRVWSLAVTNGHNRWSMHLRTFNLVPRDSRVFTLCRTGDIQGLRTLFERGEASPHDVFLRKRGLGQETTLRYAAREGKYEVCKYLLALTSWDQEMIQTSFMKLLHKLACHGRNSTAAQIEQGAGVFSRHVISDEESTAFAASRLAAIIEAGKSHRVAKIINGMRKDANLEWRFQLVARVCVSANANITYKAFHDCLGQALQHKRLATLPVDQSVSALYVVALIIFRCFQERSFGKDFDKWTKLGIRLLKHCQKSCHRGRGGDVPFALQISGVSSWRHSQRKLRATHSIHELIEMFVKMTVIRDVIAVLDWLQHWVAMMKLASVDLCQHGACEDEHWRPIHVQECGCRIEHIIYGPEPELWSLMVRAVSMIPMYKIQVTPGGYPNHPYIPLFICWTPTPREEHENEWDLVEVRHCWSGLIDLQEFSNAMLDPVHELIDGPQDDTFMIFLMECRAIRGGSSTRHQRSHSAPPNLRRREQSYLPAYSSYHHWWLPNYHLCPFDSRWRLHDVDAESDEFVAFQNYGSFDPRACVQGLSISPFADSIPFCRLEKSFIEDMDACRASCRACLAKVNDRLKNPVFMHTGDENCTQGCWTGL